MDFKMIEELYLDVVNYLVQMIDSDPDYDMSISVDEYMDNHFPEEFALCKALDALLRKNEINL